MCISILHLFCILLTVSHVYIFLTSHLTLNILNSDNIGSGEDISMQVYIDICACIYAYFFKQFCTFYFILYNHPMEFKEQNKKVHFGDSRSGSQKQSLRFSQTKMRAATSALSFGHGLELCLFIFLIKASFFLQEVLHIKYCTSHLANLVMRSQNQTLISKHCLLKYLFIYAYYLCSFICRVSIGAAHLL